jgi:transposase-like protein
MVKKGKKESKLDISNVSISEIQKKYGTETKCRAYLETLRWNGEIKCTSCDSVRVSPVKGEKRYVCLDCKGRFSVITNTIFEQSKYPLTEWFKVIFLLINAKGGLSAMNIFRIMGGSYKTAWYVAMRVRCAMIDNCIELQNIVEMDEAYVGGKPRKGNLGNNTPSISRLSTNKRGRGTSKTPIVAIVERNGNIVLQVTEKITSSVLLKMLKESVDIEKSIVVTDEFPAYKSFDKIVEHLVINHKKGFSQGIVHTNTLESFFSIIKNSMRGQYIALSKKYLPLYLVEAQWKFNRRNAKNDLFKEFLMEALTSEKCLLNYKPMAEVKTIVYKSKKEVKC